MSYSKSLPYSYAYPQPQPQSEAQPQSHPPLQIRPQSFLFVLCREVINPSFAMCSH